MITKASVQAFFAKMEAEADAIADEAEKAVAKDVALAGQFLRSTYAKLASDPAVVAVIQGGFADAAGRVLAAVETGGASLLPGLCLEEAKNLVIAAGKTVEHSLVPIVAGELHASLEAASAATPEHVNN